MEFENDLGKPWRYEDGEFTVTRSSVWSPPGCHPVGCGVKFYVDKDGKLDHVEGDENNPITKGRLCARCLALKDYIYNPSRVIYPMKRDPKDRGKDKWERITWDEAYDLIKEKRDYFAENYGPESIICLDGTGRDGGTMAHQYAQRALGTPNLAYCQSGFACYLPRILGSTFACGIGYPEVDYAGGLEGTYDNPVYKVPEVMIMWGKMPLASNPDGMFGHAVIDLMKRGSKLISIDPRVNWLSTRATIRLRLRPNTDTALAMAFLNIIISEDLYDHEFVDKWCYGFDELAERVKTMPPEKAAEICELDVEDIYAAARMYANAKPAQLNWGLAVDQNPNGIQLGQCCLALMAITGNLDVPGGHTLGAPADEQSSVNTYGWDSLSEELQNKIIGLEEYPAYVMIVINAHADMLLETLETGKPYPIKMCHIESTNLLAPTCSAQPLRWHAALSKLEWSFATDLFITPTIQACCDLILPLATAAEHDALTYSHYSLTPITYGAMSKAIQVGECKSDWVISYELGKKLAPEKFDMYNDYHEFINDVRGNGQITWEEMHEEVCRQRGVVYRKYEKGLLREDGQPGFSTPTGRVELYSLGLEENGDDPLPYYIEPPVGPRADPEAAKKYPFVLTTGARTYSYFHSEHRQVARLRELNPDPIAEINPEDAKKLGLADGQWVELENQFGKAKLKAQITPTVYPGLVHAQHGWWFPERDGEEPNLFGVWLSNVNSLVPHRCVGKLGIGSPYKGLICSVKPLDVNYDTDMDLVWEKFGKLVN